MSSPPKADHVAAPHRRQLFLRGGGLRRFPCRPGRRDRAAPRHPVLQSLRRRGAATGGPSASAGDTATSTGSGSSSATSTGSGVACGWEIGSGARAPAAPPQGRALHGGDGAGATGLLPFRTRHDVRGAGGVSTGTGSRRRLHRLLHCRRRFRSRARPVPVPAPAAGRGLGRNAGAGRGHRFRFHGRRRLRLEPGG